MTQTFHLRLGDSFELLKTYPDNFTGSMQLLRTLRGRF